MIENCPLADAPNLTIQGQSRVGLLTYYVKVYRLSLQLTRSPGYTTAELESEVSLKHLIVQILFMM